MARGRAAVGLTSLLLGCGSAARSATTLEDLWQETLLAFRAEIAAFAGSKDDAQRPFAFLATYTNRIGAGSRVQHRPLGQAVADSAHARDKNALLALLPCCSRCIALPSTARS
jgi:hypothetical protein